MKLDGRRRRAKREIRKKEEEKWGKMEDWSDKAGVAFGKRTEELELEKGEVKKELEKLIKLKRGLE